MDMLSYRKAFLFVVRYVRLVICDLVTVWENVFVSATESEIFFYAFIL